MSIHAVAHAAPGTLLFRTHLEAAELWRRVTGAIDVRALALMPEHVHGQLADEALRAFTDALRGYALWRNRRREASGRVFRHGIDATSVRGAQHEERTTRYIHLNPCRAGLVPDPVAWAYSTHRDALGLAIPGVRRPVRDPVGFHAWVSSDPAVAVAGTALPAGHPDRVTLDMVGAAVSALTRTPESSLVRRGPARDLLLRAALALTGLDSTEVGARLGVDPSTVRRHALADDPRVKLVARVAGDPRFALLKDGDLREDAAWRRLHPGRS